MRVCECTLLLEVDLLVIDEGDGRVRAGQKQGAIAQAQQQLKQQVSNVSGSSRACVYATHVTNYKLFS